MEVQIPDFSTLTVHVPRDRVAAVNLGAIMHALVILICMWPILSATKITECWPYYQSAWHRLGVVTLTLLGAVAWLGAVNGLIDAYTYYGTFIVWSPSWLWVWLSSYAGLGVVRYLVFREAKREPPTIIFERKKTYG